MDYKQKYEDALERAKGLYNSIFVNNDILEQIFPELKESEDEKIRKGIIEYLEQSQFGEEHYLIDDDIVRGYITWLEKQGEKTNPYSGTSFEYNGHTWGMCARDNGVDILLDKQLFKHLEEQGEQNSAWSEEDEKMLHTTLLTIRYALSIPADKEDDPCFVGSSTISWLKSLRERLKGE